VLLQRLALRLSVYGRSHSKCRQKAQALGLLNLFRPLSIWLLVAVLAVVVAGAVQVALEQPLGFL
jgi:hypothetical protein